MLNWFRANFFPHRSIEGVGEDYWRARAAKAGRIARTIVVAGTNPETVLVDFEHRAAFGLRIHTALTMDPAETKRLVHELTHAVDAIEGSR